MKLPYVKRQLLDEHKKALVESEMIRHRVESKYKRCRDDLKTSEKIIKDILPRLFKINIERNLDYETYRVCVDIHRGLVETAFTHGGDQREIEFMASLLGEQVGRKMIQFNFARCSR